MFRHWLIVFLAVLSGGCAGTPFLAAAANNDLAAIQKLAAQGENINQHDSNGTTALHYAAIKNSVDVARYLIAHGADINYRTMDGKTPLYIAAFGGSDGVVSELLSHGALTEPIENALGATALHVAAQEGRLGAVQRLLDSKAIVDSRTRRGMTPLHFAAWKRHADVVKLLLSHGADVSARSDPEATAVGMRKELALTYSCVRIINETAIVGAYPLHLAARVGDLDSITELVSHGADVNGRDLWARTPIAYAVAFGNNIDAVRFLISKGASLSQTDWTPLHLAAEMGSTPMAAILLDGGADPNAKSLIGWTPLHSAAVGTNFEAMRALLVSHKADASIKNPRGETADEVHKLVR